MKKFFIFVLMLVLAQPYLVFAAPLTGANADVGIYYSLQAEGYQEDTDDANDAVGAGDVYWAQAGLEHSYIGNNTKFNAIIFDVETVSWVAEGYDLNIEYYNGSSWGILTAIPGVDNPFQFTGVHGFSFSPPLDWAQTVPESSDSLVSAYYIRIGDGSQSAEINQISINTVAGGASAPEFSTIMYIATLGIGGMYLYWKTQKEQKLFA
jgi:hypothetical protein